MMPRTVVLHCGRLEERRRSAVEQLERHNFKDYFFLEGHEPDELSSSELAALYEPGPDNPERWTEKVLLWGPQALSYHAPTLNMAEISLTIKFGRAFQMLAEQEFDHCIVFEDDVILCEGFADRFHESMERTPDDWDVVYFGECANLHIRGATPDRIAYLKESPSSRGGVATLFRRRAVADLAETWFPFNLVSDWELSAQHHLHGHSVYWWEPTLARQGSEMGLFGSSLR